MTDVSRRAFLFGTAGAAAAGAVAGGAAAQESGPRPDWGGWLDGVDGGYVDARGQSEVTVEVGADGNGGPYAFAPAGLWVDPGTTVRWEWTGGELAHNVVAESGPAALDSGDPTAESGVNYEHTFEEGGITTYFCEPHRALGMKGAVAVGDDVATREVTATPASTANGTATPGATATANGTAMGTATGDAGGGGGGGGGPTETVVVGPGGELVFDPESLEIAVGTTVTFEWDSDGHNIVVESKPDGSDWEGTEGGADKLYDTGHTHSHTFETTGTYEYVCTPHKTAGMIGTIEVVEELSTPAPAAGPPEIPDSAKTLGIASIIGMLSTLGLAYFFMRFGGDYGGE